jgi:hypothetical protein
VEIGTPPAAEVPTCGEFPGGGKIAHRDECRAGETSQQAIFEQRTGRTEPFTSPPRQAQVCCGRRSGKTRIAALVAATAACFWDHKVYLSKGERGRVMLLATNKDQSTVAKNYVLAPLESQRSPVLVGLGGLGKSVAPPQANTESPGGKTCRLWCCRAAATKRPRSRRWISAPTAVDASGDGNP